MATALSRNSRPVSVSLIAAYEFIKAAGLLLLIRSWWSSRNVTLPSDALGKVLLPAIAVYFIVIGFGVWNLQKWARWLVLPAFALMAPRFMVLPFIIDESDFQMLRGILPQPIALAVFVLDLLVVLVLLSPEVRNAFGDVDSDL